MKNSIRCSIFFLALTIAGCSSTPRSENPDDWSEEQADAWFESKGWFAGSNMKPDPSVDKRKLAVKYKQHPKRWDAAFEFMSKGDFSLPVGDHALDGEYAFARVSEYKSKDHDEVFYESHKKYADIQFLVSGEELIGVSDLSKVTVKDPYDEEKDIAFYQDVGGHNLLAKPGTFFIFFPGDGHRPAMKVGESVPVKKIVIKVRD